MRIAVAVSLIVASYVLVLAAGWILARASDNVPPSQPAPVLWICDSCGRLARADLSVDGVLSLQAIRASHDCTGARELVTETEAFLAEQPPP